MPSQRFLLFLSWIFLVDVFRSGIFASGRTNRPWFHRGQWCRQSPSLAPSAAPFPSPEHKKIKKVKRSKTDSPPSVSDDLPPTTRKHGSKKAKKHHGVAKSSHQKRSGAAFVASKESNMPHKRKKKKSMKKHRPDTVLTGNASDSSVAESRPKTHRKIKKVKSRADSSSVVHKRESSPREGSATSTFEKTAKKKSKKGRKLHSKPIGDTGSSKVTVESTEDESITSKSKTTKKRRKAAKRHTKLDGVASTSMTQKSPEADLNTPVEVLDGPEGEANLEDDKASNEAIPEEITGPDTVDLNVSVLHAPVEDIVSLDAVQAGKSSEEVEDDSLSTELPTADLNKDNKTMEQEGGVDDHASFNASQVAETLVELVGDEPSSVAPQSNRSAVGEESKEDAQIKGDDEIGVDVTTGPIKNVEQDVTSKILSPTAMTMNGTEEAAIPIEDIAIPIEDIDGSLEEDVVDLAREKETEAARTKDLATNENAAAAPEELGVSDETINAEGTLAGGKTNTVDEDVTNETASEIAGEDEPTITMAAARALEPETSADAFEDESTRNSAEIAETSVLSEHVAESGLQQQDSDEDADGSDDDGESVKVESTATQAGNESLDEKDESPEDPYLDPDVVHFIGNVLDEDIDEVRAWTNADSSSNTDGGNTSASLNETRGGSQTAMTPNVTRTDNVSLNTSSEGGSDVLSRGGPTKIKELDEPKMDQEDSMSQNTTVVEKVADGIKTNALNRKALEVSEDKKTDAVVSIVTWNLAEESPGEEDAAFIRAFRAAGVKKGAGSDLVLISGQECENIKPRRTEGRRSREYRRLMIKMLGKGYVPIALHLLGGIQFGLFAKKSFLKEIEHVSVADVTCGIGNVFHNKGAIAAFVQVKARNPPKDSPEEPPRSKSLRMMFVTAHMAAHVKNSDARNADFWRISSELEAQAPEGFLPGQQAVSEDNGRSFLFDSVDRAFFCGDLNYRIDLPREVVEYTILNGDPKMDWVELMKHDQLFRTMTEGSAFPGFAEGMITFAPTFKFDKETGDYDTSHKQRIPAWTDRILFKPWGIRVLSYQSAPGAQHSDHRPVYGTFRLSMEGRVLPPSKQRRKRQKKDQ